MAWLFFPSFFSWETVVQLWAIRCELTFLSHFCYPKLYIGTHCVAVSVLWLLHQHRHDILMNCFQCSSGIISVVPAVVNWKVLRRYSYWSCYSVNIISHSMWLSWAHFMSGWKMLHILWKQICAAVFFQSIFCHLEVKVILKSNMEVFQGHFHDRHKLMHYCSLENNCSGANPGTL